MKNLMTQNTLFRRAALASVIVAGGLMATNSMAADDTAAVTATVVVPITITQATDMAFGSFAAPVGAGDTVTLSSNGNLAVGGTAVLIGGGAGAAASFNITGAANLTFDVAVTTSLIPTSGVNTMALAPTWDFAGDATDNSPATGDLGAGGAVTLFVGGALTVADAQVPGVYTGEITADVDYN